MRGNAIVMALMAGLAVWSCDDDEIEVGKYQMANETSDTVYVNLYGLWYQSVNKELTLAAGETYIIAATSDESYEKNQYRYRIDSVKMYRDAERQRCVFRETQHEYYRNKYDIMKFYTSGGNWTEELETQGSGDNKIIYHTYTFRITEQILGER